MALDLLARLPSFLPLAVDWAMTTSADGAIIGLLNGTGLTLATQYSFAAETLEPSCLRVNAATLRNMKWLAPSPRS
jgi:hypothetical protein